MKSRQNRDRARSLHRRAGRAVRETHFEALEERRLLFSLSITPADDFNGDGLGTVSAQFGYTIPYLDSTPEVAEGDPEAIDEDFNDEGVGPVASGRVFDDSDIRVTHNFGFGGNFRLAEVVPGEENELWLDINARNGSVWTFEPFAVDDDGGLIANLAAIQVSFTIFGGDDNQGMLPNDFFVDLLLFDQVTATYTGSELIARNTSGDLNDRLNGVGTFVFDADDTSASALTGVRIRSTRAENLTLDDLQFLTAAGLYADIVEERIFGAEITFTGPIGATVEILDLYGRSMQRTLALGKPDGIELTLVDLDDDGIPNFNDGIGQIRFSGVDARATFSIFGGTIEFDNDLGFVFERVDNFVGLFDDFQSAGFGYLVEYDDSGEPTNYGLPPGPGSVIIGSPFVRNNANTGTYNPAGRATGPTIISEGFTRPDQGVFVTQGESMGSVYVHGILHGSSRFTGALGELYAGYLPGTVTVDGDLRTAYVGSEAGFWVSEEDADANVVVSTGAELIVGRTLGELAVGGRSAMSVTVRGDLNSPALRPPGETFRFVEREKIFAFDEADNPEAAIITDIQFPIGDLARLAQRVFVSPDGRTPIFVDSTLRNDTLLGAEFVGGPGTAVEIAGTIGYGDPVNGEDGVDIFAFPVDGTRPVDIQINSVDLPGYVRVLDQNGVPLAATAFEDATFGLGFASVSQTLRFTPPRAGVYYLEISDIGVDLVDGSNTSGWEYVATITGMAPVTLGSYRTGGSSGVPANPLPLNPTVQTITGNIGIIRVGTGYVDAGGADASVLSVMNRPPEEDDDAQVLVATSFNSAGNVYSFVAGSDIEQADLFVNGDLGELYVGMSPVAALSGDGLEGDVVGFFVQVSGRIGVIDIKGGVGLDNDVDDPPAFVGGIGLDIQTGRGGGDGTIGSIRIGGDVFARTLRIATSPGSTVGALLVSQDRGDEGNGIYQATHQSSDILLGSGSDLRFVDLPRIDTFNSVDASFSLFVNQSVEFVDDAGGVFTIEVQGPIPGALAGVVRVVPVDNGQGVAVARIDSVDGSGVDLSGGRTLRIASTGRLFGNSRQAPISIGRIDISAADAQSAVVIEGQIEIDVWRITSAAPLNRISNTTPGGDIVAIDVAGLTDLEIRSGNLGFTQVPSFGVRDFGVLLGIASSEQTGVDGPLGVAEEGLIGADIADGFRPVGALGGAYLEDIGAPLDPYLNGLVVRGGDVNNISVSGMIGDVILQGGGTLNSVIADSDFVPGVGQTDGIRGSIYAQVINSVDVGQGLMGTRVAPFADAGIFASDELRSVIVNATLHEGAFLSGVVIATDIVPGSGPPGDPDIGGIGNITVTRGVVRDAYIGSMNLDAFLTSYLPIGEVYAGTIGRIGGTDLTIFRSRIEANNIDNLSLGQGTYDATVTNVGTNLGNVDLRVAQNSTIGGGRFEFGFNRIVVSGNIGSFRAGEVSDLRIEALGRVTGSVQSDNWRRVEFQVSGSVPRLEIAEALVASRVSVGELRQLSAEAIRTSQISASGLLGMVTSSTEILNTAFEVTGGQGRITSITAPQRIVGSVSATGPVGTISTTVGDLVLDVTTTTDRGTVASLSAARDLVLTSSISAGVGSLAAGRNIGRPGEAGMIFVAGDLAAISAGGHLYTDVRVGQNLESATIGRAVNRPGQPMARSGSFFVAERIASISVDGDYGGRIVSYTNGIASITINNGSLLPGGGVEAYDGDIESLVIAGGNLYADLYTDRSIRSVVVEPTLDGVFGDVGVNPAFSAGVGYDAFRGQVPPGVQQTSGKDGPNIVAEVNIESFVVAGGSVFEATFFAGREIVGIEVNGSVRADTATGNTGRPVIAAGEQITSLAVTGNINLAAILAGVRSLGADLDAGGFGENADTTQSGRIVGITVGGNLTNSAIAAGVNPGSDREYNTGDELLEIGVSTVGPISVGGSGAGTTVYTDTLLPGALAGGKLIGRGASRPVNHPDIAQSTAGDRLTAGVNFAFDTSAGEGFVRYTGPGSVFFDAATNRVILSGTTGATNVLVRAEGDRSLTDFDIVSTEGASVGLIRVEAFRLLGDSDIVIDENIGRLELGTLLGTGTIQAGNTLGSFISGDFRSGSLIARSAGSVVIAGEYGDADVNVRGEALMSFRSLTSARFNGAMRAGLSVRYDLGSVAMPGGMSGGLIRAGHSIDSISAASVSRSRINAGQSLQSLNVAGDMFDSAVMVGADLGDDAEIGGSGFAADRVGAGVIGSVSVGGDFLESDIVAGFLRGPDGFFGTADDLLASGRSSIGSVTIAGVASGTNRFSEDYRIASTGSLGTITVGGSPFGGAGNLVVESVALDPLPIQVGDIDVRRDAGEYVATLPFNQRIDFSSLDRALSVSEVRGLGEIEIRLIQGEDYFLEYNEGDNSVSVTFSRALIERDLPLVGDQPARGVYRFTIESSFVRGSAVRAELDGNGDGTTPRGDDFIRQNIVGDAGDKFTPEIFDIPGRNGLPDRQVSHYGPINLNLVLDDATNPNGLPEPNTQFTIRGAIGDHPDHDPDFFSFSSDTDIYTITLQAGQILRLGAMQGPAQLAQRVIVQPDGGVLSGSTPFGLELPFEPVTSENREILTGQDYLIRQTGTYAIVVANTLQGLFPGVLPDLNPVPFGVGDYAFTLNVFDDGDSGFNADTNAGDGQDLVNAPAPSAFAGADGILGTADDPARIVIGSYTFTYNAGPDGVPGTADDFVSGSNGSNVSSMTDAMGTRTVSVEAAIGDPGFAGVPSKFMPDVDVFHLNAGNPIPTGSVIRATLKLSDLGSDLGSFVGNLEEFFLVDNFVQFAVFDTSTSRAADDALLLYAPTDVSPNGGPTGVIAESNNVTYGYDENGDFYIEFVAPGRQDSPGTNASYALYVQGVLNTDYRLEVVTSGSRQLVQRKQNFLIETRGGTVDWLEVAGQVTPVEGFDPASLGFTGRVSNGQRVGDFIIDGLVRAMNDTFANVITGPGPDGVFGTGDDLRGLDVTVSANPVDFDFQDYSTIFVSSMFDPREPIFSVDGFGELFSVLQAGELFSQPYAYSQHSDPGNADLTDEAIIFVPNLAILEYTPSEADLNSLVQSLSAVALRRAGELMGLRLTEAYGAGTNNPDVMAINSPEDIPGAGGQYQLPSQARRLSPSGDPIADSDFFLGYQNAARLLGLYTRSN